jgi:hypothetical protein
MNLHDHHLVDREDVTWSGRVCTPTRRAPRFAAARPVRRPPVISIGAARGTSKSGFASWLTEVNSSQIGLSTLNSSLAQERMP